MQNILKRNFRGADRILAVSDIHGDFDLLEALLEKLKLTGRDILVFNGDYLNRGPRSADTLGLIMRLAKRENVFVLKGNLERLVDWYMVRGVAEDIVPHFSEHKNNLFCDWAGKAGLGPVNVKNYYDIRAALLLKYGEQIEYLKSLPAALETEDFVFVHAGLSESGRLCDSTEQNMVKNDDYLARGKNATGKWVIVGHTPVWNLPESKNTNNPVIFYDRRIIGIDGGNRVKSFSQLNALKITYSGGKPEFESLFTDAGPRVYAAEDFRPESANGCFKDTWPHFSLKILERGEQFSLCENTVTGEQGPVKNEHIGYSDGGACFARNTCSCVLAVKKGEPLYLQDKNGGDYAFVKKMTGEVGWVEKSAICL